MSCCTVTKPKKILSIADYLGAKLHYLGIFGARRFDTDWLESGSQEDYKKKGKKCGEAK